MKNNPVLEAVLDELGTAGASVVSLEQPRHIKLRYEHNGAAGTTTVATTPSDWRAPLNARAQIRKALNGVRAQSVPTPNVNITTGDEQPVGTPRLRQAPHPTRLRNGAVLPKGEAPEFRSLFVMGHGPALSKAPRIRTPIIPTPRPPKPPKPQLAMVRSSVALRVLQHSADRVSKWWPALMMRIHDRRDKGEFLRSLMMARVFANAAMDSRTYKIWRDQTRRLTPEHRLELVKIQHTRGTELRRCARVLRNLLPTPGRLAYLEVLVITREWRRERRAARKQNH